MPKSAMNNTFFQKLMLTVLAGAVVAAFYVFFYEGLILNAQNNILPTPAATR